MAFAAEVWIRYIDSGLNPGPWLVFWDETRQAVRTIDGGLLWYRDRERQAHLSDSGDLVVVRVTEATLYPRQRLEREALAVRSLESFMDWANVEHVVSQAGEVVHMTGADGTFAVVTRSEEHGVILDGAGARPIPWTVRVDNCRMIDPTEPALALT